MTHPVSSPYYITGYRVYVMLQVETLIIQAVSVYYIAVGTGNRIATAA